MTWMNRNLTLDLLAIGIDTLQRTYDRIKKEPDSVSPWPQVESTQDAPGPVEENQEPAPQQQAEPQPQQVETQPEAPQEPEDQDKDLLPEAQTILRHISLAEGPAWITGVLFPHFGVKTLTDVPKDKLPELISMATEHKEALNE